MDDLKKVNSMQLYLMWKQLTIGILACVAVVAVTRMLPFFLAPAVGLGGAAALYTVLYYNRLNKVSSCSVSIYALFYCLIAYSFVSISINVLYAWGLILVPDELIFFNRPYISVLVLAPVSFITLLVMYFKRHSLELCVECRLFNGDHHDRGILGQILHDESALQLRNLAMIFGIISAVVWTYFECVYVKININSRDWYVFTWLYIIAFVLDELYFIFRYYNLYLDLKETNEIISQDEINDMSDKTYIRYYVICENKLFVDTKAMDPAVPYREVIDTPFITRRSVSGIRVDEVRGIIARMSGVSDGELRFFYGRKSADMDHHLLMRYFYFLNGSPEDYPELNVDGEWMDFEKVKYIYATSPGMLSHRAISDLTRLATIIQTEKLFDSQGFRKNRIKSYTPHFNLKDVRNSTLDFQDDKWIRISLFNSDTPFYRIKKWWRRLSGRDNNRRSSLE